MGREERYKTEAKQKEIAELSAAVTRAIATMIHTDEFLTVVGKSFTDSIERNGTYKLDDKLTVEVMQAISLLSALQNGTYKSDSSQLNADIRLISAYNDFNYAAYIQKMHEMILQDESNKEITSDEATSTDSTEPD